jgi:hypothetical protein
MPDTEGFRTKFFIDDAIETYGGERRSNIPQVRRTVHAAAFFFGLCCGRRAVDGVAFVPTLFGSFDATG